MVTKAVNITMRALQFFWALLVLALTGNMIAEATHGNPSVVNYSTACSVIALLSLFYLIPATLKEGLSFHPIILITVDVFNTLLWFCAAVALAAQLDVHSCGVKAYTSNNRITNGTTSGNQPKRCHEAQAVCAFLWFGFVSFAISSVLSGIGSGSSANLRGGRPGGPSVSRV